MRIAALYSSASVESPLSAYMVYAKYYGQRDPNGNFNIVELYDINGVTNANITTLLTYTMGGATYHRIFDFCAHCGGGTTTGQLNNTQLATILAKLITKAVDPISDTKVIRIAPATFPFIIGGGKNQAQNTWTALFSYVTFPLVQGFATSGGAGTLTDTALPALVVDHYAGYWISIIAGLGAGQVKQIISNTVNQFAVIAWDTNPDNTSVYQVTKYHPLSYPQAIAYLGSGSFPTLSDTATVGANTSITGTQTYTVDAYSEMWVLIYSGTGKGQINQVVKATTPGTANSTTVIFVQNAWTTNPDATSLFIVVPLRNEVYALHSFAKWLWTYCTKLATDPNTFVRLNKLMNHGITLNPVSSIANKEGFDQVQQDSWFIEHIVLPQGRSCFDIAIAGASPVLPQ